MKIVTFFLLVCIIPATAHVSLSQDKKFSMSEKALTLESLFKKIENISSYRFLYRTSGYIDLSKRVDVAAENKKLSDILNDALSNTGINYTLVGENLIVISPAQEQQEPIKVSGIVTDQDGLSVIGASVIIKGKIKGTATDADGRYLIETEGNDTLLFSCIGMKPVTISVSNQGIINVTMESEVAQIAEVIVTGYQTISRERATGSFVKISGEQLTQKRLSSLSSVLEGQIAGYSDGLLRGTTSMNGMTNPLYVIDGFPVENTRYESTQIVENLPNINLEDIESITVLKDAAATSIYGARAANGVIVITTKKASKATTEISFSAEVTTSPYSYYTKNLTDAGDIIGLEKEWAAGNPNLQVTANGSGFVTDAAANAYALSLRQNAVYKSQGMQALLDYYSGKMSQTDLDNKLSSLGSRGYKYYRDVEKYAKRNPVFQKYNLNVGKASDKNTFNMSATYKKNKYEDIYSNDESIGINIRNSNAITKWLTFDIGCYTFYSKTTDQTYSALSPGFSYQPYDGLVDDMGNAFTSTAASRLNSYSLDNIANYGLYSMDITPLDELGMNLKKSNDFSNRTYTKLNFKITDWLRFSSSFQYEYGVGRIRQLKDENSYAVRSMVNGLATVSSSNEAVYNLPYGNIFYRENQFSNAYNFRNQVDFHKTFAGKHDLTVLVGSETRHSKLEYSNTTQYGYNPDLLSYTPVNQNTLINTSGTLIGGVYLYQSNFAQQQELVNRFVSFYSNIGYTYSEKYLFTGSLRWDRSNLWGTDNKYQNKPTWSAGIGWNINKESFFKADWVDMLKLRVSYGIGGNIAKNSAPYMTASYFPNTNVGGTYGSINSRPNPKLSWEKTTTTNVGIDFSVLKGRFSGTLEFYNKMGTDLLANTMGVPTEGWGYSTYTINNGEMRNRGYELTLSGSVIKINNFEWTASLAYGYNKNEVTYVNVEAPVYYLQIDYPSAYPRIGKSYNTIYGYKWAGLSSTGLPQVFDSDGNATSTRPTDLESIVSCGSSVPAHTGSFGSAFRYKNFELSCLFVFQAGYKLRNTNLPTLTDVYSSATYSYIPTVAVTNKKINNRWREAGDEAKTNVPRAVFEYDPEYTSDLSTIYSLADINVVNASHVRLSNVSLSYRIPSAISQKLKFEDVRLNFNVENLYTFAANKDAKYMLGGYASPNYVFGINLNF